MVMVAGLGAGVGAVLGGPLGAGAGVLALGAACNLYRGQAGLGSDTPEAAKRLTLGVLGLAGAGYLVYRCYSKKRHSS
jgi:hypothetical protein